MVFADLTYFDSFNKNIVLTYWSRVVGVRKKGCSYWADGTRFRRLFRLSLPSRI